MAELVIIAGPGSGGAAGRQAGNKTASALGVHAATAITAQNTLGVQAVAVLEPAMVARQIAWVLDDIRIDAVKIGMLPVFHRGRQTSDRGFRHCPISGGQLCARASDRKKRGAPGKLTRATIKKKASDTATASAKGIPTKAKK